MQVKDKVANFLNDFFQSCLSGSSCFGMNELLYSGNACVIYRAEHL